MRRIDGGRWQARYNDPLTGKRVTAPSTFATKGDAGRWLARVQAGIVDANVVAAQRDQRRCEISNSGTDSYLPNLLSSLVEDKISRLSIYSIVGVAVNESCP